MPCANWAVYIEYRRIYLQNSNKQLILVSRSREIPLAKTRRKLGHYTTGLWFSNSIAVASWFIFPQAMENSRLNVQLYFFIVGPITGKHSWNLIHFAKLKINHSLINELLCTYYNYIETLAAGYTPTLYKIVRNF